MAMFIHIGGDTMVALDDIIGIFPIRVQQEPAVQKLLERLEREARTQTVDVGEVKSMVLTERAAYFSPISSATLKRRASILETAERIEFR